ncbi:necrosis inducing protein-domain-containing protein [Colletotrichum cereale]|nr:necrosis inducing protein-domain-containing protein [Colletotrichum cereale]
MQLFSATALLLGSALTTVSATPIATAHKPFSTPNAFIKPFGDETSNLTQLAARDIRGPLPVNALPIEHQFQPVLDFDGDGCYYTAAIDGNGDKNGGLSPANGIPPNCLRATCRDNNRLENSNVYSRSRCNNGWCAIMYEYYFEKDQVICGSWGGGHRHDWENIVVFVQDGQVKRVAPSCHGKYGGATNTPRLDGERAKVVYHKDSGQTHCFRMANEADDNVENYTGNWFLGALVGWTGWPSTDIRDKAMEKYGEGPKAKLSDGEFASNLRNAMGGQTGNFNPDVDG